MYDATKETVRFKELRWLEPVDSAGSLPEIEDGPGELLCYVEDESAIYQLTNGVWIKCSSMGRD